MHTDHVPPESSTCTIILLLCILYSCDMWSHVRVGSVQVGSSERRVASPRLDMQWTDRTA